jgi:predicted RNA polymerase sigma factor
VITQRGTDPYTVDDPPARAGHGNEAGVTLVAGGGHLVTSGSGWRRDLSQDTLWLTGLLCQLLPAEPEALGLALMRLHLASADARFTSAGDLVRLADQDRSQWDHDTIAEAVALIERAAALRRPGP